MKKIVLMLLVALSAIALYSCKQDAPDAHNARNSLDWTGLYSGAIPSASGPGIYVTLTLISENTDDLRYKLRYEYINQKDGIFTVAGAFTWNNAGTTITLDANTKKFPVYYEIGENKVTQLDTNGKKITGDLADQYVLTKQQEQ